MSSTVNSVRQLRRLSRRPFWTTLSLVFLFLALARTGAAQASHVDAVNLPLADYLALVREAREHDSEKPSAPAAVTMLSAQRVRVEVDGGIGHVATRFEIEARGAGGAPVLLPVAGRIESVSIEGKGVSKLYRTTGASLAFVPQEAGRYVATFESHVERRPGAEAFEIATRTGIAPISVIELTLPAEAAWEMAGAVKLEDEVTGKVRHVRLAPPSAPSATSEGLGIVSIRTAAAPSKVTATAVARSVVVTHLDLRADEIARFDTVLVEVLRGELSTIEARLPAGLVVERAWMDDGSEVAVGPASAEGTVVQGKRSERLVGSGFLKILSRRAGAPPADLPLDFVEPSIAVRARYLVVSSSVVATLAPQPEASWSTIDLTDPPDSIEAELAARPPIGGWRLESQAVRPALRIAVLPAVDRSPLPIADRSTTTYVNPDGSLLVQDRFLLLDHRDALELSFPEGLRFESATVDGDVVRPIERNGKHLLPLRYRDQDRTSIEISFTDRPLAATQRATRRSFALAELEAGPGGEVLRHTWTLHLPPGLSARLTGGNLRPIPRIQRMAKRKASAKDDAGYYDFDAYEEMEVAPPLEPIVSDGSAALEDKRAESADKVATSDLGKVPTPRDPWAVMQNTPGVIVDRINVGGNEASQQSLNRAGTAVEVRPSFEAPPGGTEMRLSGALPPRRVTAEIEVKETKKRKG